MNTPRFVFSIRATRTFLLSLCGGLIGGLSPASAAADGPKPVAAVFLEKLPGLEAEFAREMAGLAEEAGFELREIDATILTNSIRMGLARIDLLILPNARVLPVDSVAGVEAYLKTGGDLLAFGLPAWKDASFPIGGR